MYFRFTQSKTIRRRSIPSKIIGDDTLKYNNVYWSMIMPALFMMSKEKTHQHRVIYLVKNNNWFFTKHQSRMWGISSCTLFSNQHSASVAKTLVSFLVIFSHYYLSESTYDLFFVLIDTLLWCNTRWKVLQFVEEFK